MCIVLLLLLYLPDLYVLTVYSVLRPWYFVKFVLSFVGYKKTYIKKEPRGQCHGKLSDITLRAPLNPAFLPWTTPYLSKNASGGP